MNGWYPVEPMGNPGCPSGIIIDGVHYALGGQPPKAQTKRWGNLSFMYQ
jgi:hypothetical protein